MAYCIAQDEDAMICDLAQYYNIYDYEQFPAGTIATLVYGLPEESRTVRNRTGNQYTSTEMILAGIFDRVSLLLYAQTKDARKNRNRPKSLLEEMMRDKSQEITTYNNANDFEKARKEILKRKGKK